MNEKKGGTGEKTVCTLCVKVIILLMKTQLITKRNVLYNIDSITRWECVCSLNTGQIRAVVNHSLTPKNTAGYWARAKAAMLCNSICLSTVCTQLSLSMQTLLRKEALSRNGLQAVAFRVSCAEDRNPGSAFMGATEIRAAHSFSFLSFFFFFFNIACTCEGVRLIMFLWATQACQIKFLSSTKFK